MDSEIFLTILEKYGPAVVIAVGTIITAYLFNRIFRSFILRSSLILKNNPTTYQFFRHAITAVIYLVGIGWAIHSVPQMRAIANSLLAGAGILAVALSLASQQAFSNIVSGIFIVIFKPFRVNDRLTLQSSNLVGIVEDVTLRHTIIRDFENRRILIPNSVISEEVIVNADFADEKICKFIDVGVAYGSDIDVVRAILQDVITAHPLSVDRRDPIQVVNGDPQVPVRVIGLADSAVLVRASAWTQNAGDAFALGCDVYETILKRFPEAGIEIPFPHRTIIQKQVS